MKLGFLFVVVLSSFLLACAGSTPPANSNASAQPSPNQPAASAANSASTDDNPAPPPGALYTILCQSFQSPTHVADANRVKQYMISHTGTNQWYCYHMADESDLFYGYYQTYDDRSQATEFNRAQTDRAKIAAMVDELGDRLFTQVIFQPISLPDPVAPKEWELYNSQGYWTLVIGEYKDNPARKQAAVDAVKQLRAQGIEAYYHHFPEVSDVYVGSWPRGAIKEQAASAAAANPNADILVLTSPIPGFDPSTVHTSNGRPLEVFMPKLEVLDPTLQARMEQFKYWLINGQAMGRENQQLGGKVVPYPSYVLQIPRPDDNNTDANSQNMQDNKDTSLPRDPMVPMPEPSATPQPPMNPNGQ